MKDSISLAMMDIHYHVQAINPTTNKLQESRFGQTVETLSQVSEIYRRAREIQPDEHWIIVMTGIIRPV